MPWTAADLPSLWDRTIVVTGGNSGLGLETARELARAGARVVIACRSLDKAKDAIDDIGSSVPGATVEAQELDLASLESVRAFAERFDGGTGPLHALVNNAGVMALPRRVTQDGFEMQFGTNHLGHFALTGRLLPRLLATPGARIVNVSSTAHRIGRIRFDDLQGERSYQKWLAYGQSKLANLLFTYELQRRLEAAGAGAISVACHPGYAATNLQQAGPRMAGSRFLALWSGMNALFAQSAAMGALPTLYAAAAEDVRGGEYFGPDSLAESRGHPVRVKSSRASHDRAVAERLWDASVELTGVDFGVLGPG